MTMTKQSNLSGRKSTVPSIPRIRMFLYFKNGKVKRYRSGGARRFLYWIRRTSAVKFDVLVTYGTDIDCRGHKEVFTNQYVGTNKQEAIKALQAFVE